MNQVAQSILVTVAVLITGGSQFNLRAGTIFSLLLGVQTGYDVHQL